MINEETITEIRRVSKVHEDWLVHAIVGPDLLTKGELDDLQVYGSLPLDFTLDIAATAYSLGKSAAHLQSKDYNTLTTTSDVELSYLDRSVISNLRVLATTEVRRVAQFVLDSVQNNVQACLVKGISSEVGIDVGSPQSINKASNLLQKIHDLVIVDLIRVAKNQAMLHCMTQREGLYTEGLDSNVVVKKANGFDVCKAKDLLSKSLSGVELCYVPPGSAYIDNTIQIVDKPTFRDALAKSVAGVSGGISPTVTPAGPPKPKTVATPGSIPGVAAPGNVAGPGRGKSPNAPKTGVEYDDWKGPGEARPEGEGWEQSTTGGWRHIKGAGGAQSGAQQDPETLKQKQVQAIRYGRTPHKPEEVIGHLREGTLVSIKKLSKDEAGIHNTFRVTTESGGRGLMKPSEYQSAETHGSYAGTGYGSVPRNNSHGHEVAAYKAHTMMGMDVVPPTTVRSFDGVTHSIQAWAEDHTPTEIHVIAAPDVEEKNKTKALLSMVPEHKKEEFKNKLMGLITMDIVTNNNDRHRDNLLVHKNSTGFKAIDHSDSFGTGMKGIRNDFHHDFHRSGVKVVIPKTLQTNLRGKSLGDFKRALGGHLQDWQVGQTYLRAQYVLHLQDTEGHLDYGKFLPTMDTFHGDHEHPMKAVRRQDDGSDKLTLSKPWRVNNSGSHDEFDRRVKEKLLPNDLFESFAKQFLNDHKNNPESVYHAAAKELDELGVFMPGKAMADPKAFRRTGAHKAYEKTISARHPPIQPGHHRNLAGPDSVDPVAATQVDRLNPVVDAATIRERRKGPRRNDPTEMKTSAKGPVRREEKRKAGRRATDV